ncbi:DUF3152 domain-containing protein [Streptomyces sp. NPDC058382]|uniref:DUF3152 domain-containing protein n=1 Tax=unclassified Streptomyces TaxID=2593676 RepID=UPI00362A5C7E
MPTEVSRQKRQQRGRGTRRRARQERRRRGRIRVLVAVLVPTALVGIAVLAAPLWSGGDDLPAAAAAAGPTGSTALPPATAPGPDSTSGAGRKAGGSGRPTPKAGSSPGAGSGHRTIPASGPGTFTVARAGVTSGGGNAYRVEVEDGTGVDPDKAAAQVADILAAPRGWAHGGAHTFHQVSEGSAGLVIRIATAATTDKICGQSGLDTHGEVNCRVGVDVMVNLKRWQTGSPEFDGPLADYRALIINHEVGHWLGHGHEDCPGKGRPAPAMMQQIYGLKGCVSNAWPYDAKGKYLGGPSVP